MNKEKACINLILILIFSWVFTANGQTPVTLPANYSSNSKVSSIRTWAATAPEESAATLITRPLKDVKQTISYFDGLGRLLQTVVKKGSLVTGGDSADLVSPVTYDEFGREQYKYLPFAANNAGSNTSIKDGLFKLNPFPQQAQFYNNQLAGQSGETNVSGSLNWAYGKTTIEVSPLSRVQEAFAPGASWVGTSSDGNESNRHSVKTKYLVNTITDSVRLWTVTDVANDWGTYSTSNYYAAGELYKNMVVDEQGKQVVEFKGKEGQVLLKKVQFSASADDGSGRGHTGWLCTYYVYDNNNRLRLVIQPVGVERLLEHSWDLTWSSNVLLNEQCFRYEYDERNRMIRKKVPGAGDVYMVYDRWDRLVLTQDANLRTNNQWIYTKYDELNRPIITGLHYDPYNPSLAQMINNVKDNEGWQIRYESRDVNSPSGYTLTQSYPYQVWQSVYTATFYDNYDWSSSNGAQVSSTRVTSYDSYLLPVTGSWPYAEPVTQTQQTTGLVTGSLKRIFGTENFLTTLNIYDEKGRVIQIQGNNISGAGPDITTTQYSFSGQPLVVINKSAFTNATTVAITKLEYDDLGRLLTTKKTVNSTISGQTINKPEQTMASNEYDALGQLKKKTLGGSVETLDYNYNIRGWMLGANRKYLYDQSNGAFTDRYFGFELGYDKSGTMPGSTNFSNLQYNGNIAGTIWKSRGDQVRRKYDFEYDSVGRFGKATFFQDTAVSGGTWNTTLANFSVHGFDADNGYKMKYDANGNILSMVQHGIVPGNADLTVDALRYTYKSNSNQLQQVSDDLNVADTKLGDFHYAGTKSGSTIDYVYDDNGNLTTDNNKNIAGITYNFLNLPVTIPVTGKGSIEYLYDASGNKLSKTVHETGKADKVTYYNNGFVYEDNVLQFMGTEEGRLRYVKRYFLNGDSMYDLVYDYFLKDHLGNVRMVLTEQQDTTQYFATMEAAYRAKEDKLFYNLALTNYPTASVPGGYPTDGATNPNDSLARVNGSGNKVGPALVLKVMSGDKVDIAVKSFYRNNGSAGSNVDPVIDLLSSLAAGIVGTVGESKGTLNALNNNTTSPLLSALRDFHNGNNGDLSGKPKAYLNWILLDDQLNYVAASSGAIPVGNADLLNSLANTGIPMTKNGFLYIYVSNETQNWDVFFDNLAVKHYTGPITEETHYYPFGLMMAGISGKALKMSYIENKYKFNGIEHNSDFDLNMYDASYRSLDPQIGRFWQIDPKAIDEVSPYASMLNNPITFYDPLGDTTLYYDVEGNLLYQTNVKGYRNAFIVNNDHLDEAKAFFASAGNDLGSVGQFLVDAAFAVGNKDQEIGSAYDLHSISEFYEENVSKNSVEKIQDISVDNMTHIEIGGKSVSKQFVKGLKGAEVSANLVLKNGVWTVDKSLVSTQHDLMQSNIGSMYRPYVHLHPNIPQLNGKELEYSYNGRYGPVTRTVGPFSGTTGPSGDGGDIGRAKTEGKIGGTVRNIVVNYSHIYLYDGDNYGVKINRK